MLPRNAKREQVFPGLIDRYSRLTRMKGRGLKTLPLSCVDRNESIRGISRSIRAVLTCRAVCTRLRHLCGDLP
jgi:hypothetical protein